MTHTRRISLCAVATLCLLGMVGAGLLWPSNPVAGACRTVAGLVLVFFWPGALLLGCDPRRTETPFESVFHFMTAAAATSVCVESVGLAAATILGGGVGFRWSVGWFATAQLVLACSCLFAAAVFGRPVRIAVPARAEGVSALSLRNCYEKQEVLRHATFLVAAVGRVR